VRNTLIKWDCYLHHISPISELLHCP
jgi:hypothetical protein